LYIFKLYSETLEFNAHQIEIESGYKDATYDLFVWLVFRIRFGEHSRVSSIQKLASNSTVVLDLVIGADLKENQLSL
jgi:hypothetical protein